MPATPLSVNVMKLGPIGLASAYPYTDDAAVVADEARQAESLGFATRWRSGNLPMLEAAVRATNTIPVATGITPVSAVPDQVVLRIIGVDDLPAWRERLARALIG